VTSTIRVRTIIGMAVAGAIAATGLGGAALALPASAAVTVTSHFVWTAPPVSLSVPWTIINNAATNNEPNALLFVTPSYDANGVCGCVTDPAPVGVLWLSGAQQWSIVNEDLSTMPTGASFNVLVVQKATSNVFVASATSQNTVANGMTISSKAINGKSNALLQVTENVGSTLNAHPIGVVYGLGSAGNLWDIQNVDNAGMPIGATFNVLVGAKPSHGGKAVLLTGTSSNTVFGDTFVSNSETNGNPNAVVFETQNADPGLNFGAGDVAPGGVIYQPSPTDVVAVFNEDGTAMPLATHYFNLLIFSS
jgi:hypothetical protein